MLAASKTQDHYRNQTHDDFAVGFFLFFYYVLIFWINAPILGRHLVGSLPPLRGLLDNLRTRGGGLVMLQSRSTPHTPMQERSSLGNRGGTDIKRGGRLVMIQKALHPGCLQIITPVDGATQSITPLKPCLCSLTGQYSRLICTIPIQWKTKCSNVRFTVTNITLLVYLKGSVSKKLFCKAYCFLLEFFQPFSSVREETLQGAFDPMMLLTGENQC